MADPRLRRLANWFPPARLPARRYAGALFDLTAGFVYSQVTQALIESGLLHALHDRPLGVEEAAAVTSLSPEAAATLLKAAAALRLTEAVGGIWTLGTHGAALAASPGITEMIRHHKLLYADLADPLAMLRGEGEGRLARLWRYDGSADPDDVAAYSALMAASQPMVAEQAIAVFPFARHCRMLDVGGGVGAFLAQVGAAFPALERGLFDRPQVVAQARQGGIALHKGDFRTDSLPGGYDLISLVRVLHDHDDAVVTQLLARVRAALPAGGRVLIVEPLAETAGAEAMGHAYFGFYLAAMRSGRPRTFSEYRAMLEGAGFRDARRLGTPVPLVASVLTASC